MSNPLADEVRRKVLAGERLVFVVVDGRERLFKASNYGREWLRRATDKDIERVLVG